MICFFKKWKPAAYINCPDFEKWSVFTLRLPSVQFDRFEQVINVPAFVL